MNNNNTLLIEQLEKRANKAVELLPQESLTIDELAESQNVKQMVDVRALFGTWPGGKNDDFEETINELRHQNTAGGEVL